MQKKTVVLLNANDLKEAMVKHYTDYLVANPAHLADLLRAGKLDELPNLSTATLAQLAQMYRENHAGGDVAAREGVDLVLVQNAGTLEVLYERQASAVNSATTHAPAQHHG